jgi:hypothetical protein
LGHGLLKERVRLDVRHNLILHQIRGQSRAVVLPPLHIVGRQSGQTRYGIMRVPSNFVESRRAKGARNIGTEREVGVPLSISSAYRMSILCLSSGPKSELNGISA